MIEPILKGDEFLNDIKQAVVDTEIVHLWWLGQSGYLVQWQGSHLLIDPYLSDSLTVKYAGTDKPHVRMTEIVIAPEKLNFIDIVTSSHNHTDHLDGETIVPLLQANPNLAIVVAEANKLFAAQRLGVSPEQLSGILFGTALQLGPFNIHAVPSAHEELDMDPYGRQKFIGLVIQAGSRTIYHSGDTIRYPGMDQILCRWKIDLALLPINGRDPARGVAGNLNAEEAVELARDIRAGLVVPCHYDMFKFNTVSPDGFVAAAERAGQPYQLMHCGERFDL